MKCSNCEYESNIEFSYCPYCGKKNNNENPNDFVNEIINNIFEPIKDNRETILDNKQYNIKKISLDKEIQFEDIKFPSGFNKNFIQKKFDIFTINSKSGGEFFPNKEIGKIIITILISFIFGLNSIENFPEDKKFYIFFYFIFLTILAYIWTMMTNIKTKFNFYSKGINITSRNKGCTNIYYRIIFEFYQPMYIPYPKTNKDKIIFLSNYNFVDEVGKTIVCYIIQEIKKGLDLK